MNSEPLSVSAFLNYTNDLLAANYESVIIQGEVASFKINQGKWVFFDLKDAECSVNCFIPLFKLRTQIEDGMKVMIRCRPKITNWGKFSLTVEQIIPVGEGSIKKSFELLKKKLAQEGLFDPARKRPLPADLQTIGVISSTGAAGYADFIKILNERWGGLNVKVAHTQVQGFVAIDQIINALQYFNEQQNVQIIAILRGGGSADDLAIFNDEKLTRAVAASRIPVITGIGHEVDESLVDLAADLRASTPSNAAQMLTPDRHTITTMLHAEREHIRERILYQCEDQQANLRTLREDISLQIHHQLDRATDQLRHARQILDTVNPDQVLKRGYAILSGKISPGNVVEITTFKQQIIAEVKDVKSR